MLRILQRLFYSSHCHQSLSPNKRLFRFTTTLHLKLYNSQNRIFANSLPSSVMSSGVGSSPAKKRSLSSSPVKNSPIKRSKDSENMAPIVVAEAGEKIKALKEISNEFVEPVAEVKVKGQEEEVQPKLFFAKLTDKAHVPSKGSKFAAGYDLKSAYKYTVPARGSSLVKTDIQIKLPSGYYGRVAPRSGLALKNKIDVGAGVIDEDYRGNVGVILFNLGDADFEVEEGDRVAQLICEKICYPEIVELKTLDETERGEGGFGSTGVAGDKEKEAKA